MMTEEDKERARELRKKHEGHTSSKELYELRDLAFAFLDEVERLEGEVREAKVEMGKLLNAEHTGLPAMDAQEMMERHWRPSHDRPTE